MLALLYVRVTQENKDCLDTGRERLLDAVHFVDFCVAVVVYKECVWSVDVRVIGVVSSCVYVVWCCDGKL